MAELISEKNFTHLDLFSGIGGFALAAQWAGFKTMAFCEINTFCRNVLKKHWPDVLKYMDIRDLSNPDHVDLLTAGFPCQPFSVAGKKKGNKDDRYLWPEVYRVVKKSKPKWIVLENVPGIISMLDPILEDLEREGYPWETYLIPASAIGSPHKRERIWIVANSNGFRCNYGFDNGKERSFQNDGQQYMASLHSEWSQFIPESWKTMQIEDYFTFNSNASRVDDGISDRMDRIKSLGNAIVPQVIYPILKLIYLFLLRENNGRIKSNNE